MATANLKVVFIGNPLGGDDGIGPFLYNELKDHPSLKGYELLELGVIGLDLISYVEENDTLVIVDAFHSKKPKKPSGTSKPSKEETTENIKDISDFDMGEVDVGDVVLLEEKELTADFNLVSQHDFGVEETVAVLRAYTPGLKKIYVIGIKVSRLNAFTDKLSEELTKKIPEIRDEVIKHILRVAGAD